MSWLSTCRRAATRSPGLRVAQLVRGRPGTALFARLRDTVDSVQGGPDDQVVRGPVEVALQAPEPVVSSLLSSQAERAIASVVEAECPLCKVEMQVHDGRACCPCCGDS